MLVVRENRPRRDKIGEVEVTKQMRGKKSRPETRKERSGANIESKMS